MKKENSAPKCSCKNPTTNFAPDPHKAFCKRCLAHNGKCPKTGTNKIDKSCTV